VEENKNTVQNIVMPRQVGTIPHGQVFEPWWTITTTT
jgi:hypothetical protein